MVQRESDRKKVSKEDMVSVQRLLKENDAQLRKLE